MRKIALFISLVLILSLTTSTSAYQRRRGGGKKAAPAPTTPVAPTPANNVQVYVKYTNGQEVYGRLIDINMKTVLVNAENGTVVTSKLEEIAILSVGKTRPKISQQFLTDADGALRALQTLSSATDGITYSEYQPKINQAKAVVEAFIANHQQDGQAEILGKMHNAIRSFEMVVPIWTLSVGQEKHKYVYDNSAEMKPVFELFTDIKTVAWKQNDRYPIEKVIPWIWLQSARLVDETKQQLAKLRS